jgi:hypothetical protein
VCRTYCQCENGHKHQIQNTDSSAYSIGVNPNRHKKILQCMMLQPELSPRSCRQCSKNVFIINEYVSALLLLAIAYIKVENVQYTYTFVGMEMITSLPELYWKMDKFGFMMA